LWEPDRGTTLLMAGVDRHDAAGGRGCVGNLRVPPVILGLVGLGISLLHDPMRTTKRIFRLAFTWKDYKNRHRLSSVPGAAGFGHGAGGRDWELGKQPRKNLDFCREHNTDFIFSIIGEELGVGGNAAGGLWRSWCWWFCGDLHCVIGASDSFGLLLGAGPFTFLIGLARPSSILAVVTSALPNKGLPLPFHQLRRVQSGRDADRCGIAVEHRAAGRAVAPRSGRGPH